MQSLQKTLIWILNEDLTKCWNNENHSQNFLNDFNIQRAIISGIKRTSRYNDLKLFENSFSLSPRMLH